jgi:hypothetical protein
MWNSNTTVKSHPPAVRYGAMLSVGRVISLTAIGCRLNPQPIAVNQRFVSPSHCQMTPPMNDFEKFAYDEVCTALADIQIDIVPDVYVLSFYVFEFVGTAPQIGFSALRTFIGIGTERLLLRST